MAADPSGLPVDPEPEESYFASLILAVRDDAPRIGGTLRRVRTYLRTVAWRAEVVVVDDGSDDGTAQAAARWHADFDSLVVVRHANRRGFGAAARTGMMLARGEYLLVVDAQLNTAMEDVSLLLGSLHAGADVAVASRRMPGAQVIGPQPFLQRAAETTFMKLSHLLVPVGVRDSRCGLKGFRKRPGRIIAERSRVEGDAYEVEWLALAQRFNFQVMECPVRWSRARGARARTSAAMGMLRDVWRTRLRLGGEAPPGPLPTQQLLHETSFVQFDRKALQERVARMASPR